MDFVIHLLQAFCFLVLFLAWLASRVCPDPEARPEVEAVAPAPTDAGVDGANAESLLADCRERLTHATRSEQDFGDLLLTLCNAARKTGIDPELALNGACDRLIARFERAEGEMLSSGGRFETLTPAQKAEYWQTIHS